MKIVVLAGGLSTERDVSLTSGTMICNALRNKGHQAIMVDIFLGCPDMKGDPEDMFIMDGTLLEKPAISATEPDIPAVMALRKDGGRSFFGPNVLTLCEHADICYLGLHGGAGESGQVQAALDLLGIKYTGSGFMGSAAAMHKGITKAIFKEYNIPTPKGFVLKKSSRDKDIREFGIDYPCVVKICEGGSSVGVFMADNEKEYKEAVDKAFALESEVLVEERIYGREFAVGVFDGQALPVIEIIPDSGWFDYANKYQDGATREVCPADISSETASRMQKAACDVFEALGLQVYSRMDFLLDDKGDIYCLEANSLPGMTPASLIPKEARAAGIEYEDWCELLITKSLEKYN